MSSSADQAALYSELHPELVYVYCAVSSTAILIFDQIITISDEVDHIWKRKFTGASLLFFLNRYATLLKAIVGLVVTFATSVRVIALTRVHVDNSCRLGELWYNIFDIIALFVFAAFTSFRVWAIWGREIRPFLIVLPFVLVTPVLNIYRVSAESVIPSIDPLPPPFGGCQFNIGMPLSIYIRRVDIVGDTVRGVAIATDALVLVMTWLRTRGIYRAAITINTKPSLSSMLLRDGTVYFGVLLVFNTVDLIMNQTDASFNPVNLFSDVVNCILISRFMLNLRSVHSQSNHGDVSSTQGHIDFIQTNILGDLAADIDYSSTVPTSSDSLSDNSALVRDSTTSDVESVRSCQCPHKLHPGNCGSCSTEDTWLPAPRDEESAIKELHARCCGQPGEELGSCSGRGARSFRSEENYGIEIVDR